VDRQNLPAGVTVDAKTASTVRQILTERVNAFGISGADVRARGNDQYVIEVPATQPKLTTYPSGEFLLNPGDNVIGSGKDATIHATGKDVAPKAVTLTYKGDALVVKAEADKVQVNREPLK